MTFRLQLVLLHRRFTSLRWASVAAHSHPWRVHYGQQHVFSTFVVLCMLSAEETGAAVAAVAANTSSGQLAYITRPDRRLVARNHHRLFGGSFGEAGEADDEFGA